MPKDLKHFKHYISADHDDKIIMLRNAHGRAGSDLYWSIISRIYEDDSGKLEYSDFTFNSLVGWEFDTSEKVQQVINDCVDRFRLFKKDGDCIYSEHAKKQITNFESWIDQKIQAGKASHERQRAERQPEKPPKSAKKQHSSKTSRDKFDSAYLEEMRGQYLDINFDNELEKFHLYWSEGNRELKNPKLALRHWMDKARERNKEKSNGAHREPVAKSTKPFDSKQPLR